MYTNVYVKYIRIDVEHCYHPVACGLIMLYVCV